MTPFERLTKFFATKEETPKRREATIENGVSGTNIFSGIISDDYNSELSGQSAVDTYEKMRKTDGTVSAILKSVKLPILEAEYRVQPASDDKRDLEIAAFVEKNLFENVEGGFQEFLRQSMTYFDFGFSVFEKVYEVKDNQVWLKKLAFRKQSSIQQWKQIKSDYPGITQEVLGTDDAEDKPHNIDIPMWKLVVFTNDKEGINYEGISLLRTAYKHWYLKDMLYSLDGIKQERGAGVLLIELPNGFSDKDKKRAEELGRNFKISESSYIIKPNKDWGISMLTQGISDQSSSLMTSVEHHDLMIAKSILAGFLNLGSGKSGGSYALGETLQEFFTMSLNASAKYICGTMNQQMVKQLVDFNYDNVKSYPTVEVTPIGNTDTASLSKVLETLIKIGVVKPTTSIRQWAYDMFNLPVAALEEFEEETEDESVDKEEDDVEETEIDDVEEDTEDTEDGKKKDDKMIEAHDCSTYRVELSQPFRDLNEFEQRVKFSEIDKFFTENEDLVEEILSQLTELQLEDILKKAEKIIENEDVGGISNFDIILGALLISQLKDIAKSAYERGKKDSANEIKKSLPNTPPKETKLINAKIDAIVEARHDTLVDAVKFTLIGLIAAGVGKEASLRAIEDVVKEVTDKQANQIVGRVVEDSTNAGRSTTFNYYRDELYALQRSEVLDSKTCPICMAMDGRIVKPSDPFAKLGQVHTYCRGIWVAIVKTDSKLPAIKGLPKYITDRFVTNEGVPRTNVYKPLPEKKNGKK